MYKAQGGFTLIELSIVLVIIGLIVGGVLVGQDLISGASLRAQIAQLEKYQTAVNTFKLKYGNHLPGDFPGSLATQFGFASRSGATGHGDDNGLLDSCDGNFTLSSNLAGCETVFFWSDLSAAKLIDGSFTDAADNTNASLTTADQVATLLPRARINGNFVAVARDDVSSGYITNTSPAPTKGNVFVVGQVVSIGDFGAGRSFGEYRVTGGLTPLQLSSIDTKTDDGVPTTGRVRAVSGNEGYEGHLLYYNINFDTCVAVSGRYNTSGNYASQMICNLALFF